MILSPKQYASGFTMTVTFEFNGPEYVETYQRYVYHASNTESPSFFQNSGIYIYDHYEVQIYNTEALMEAINAQDFNTAKVDVDGQTDLGIRGDVVEEDVRLYHEFDAQQNPKYWTRGEAVNGCISGVPYKVPDISKGEGVEVGVARGAFTATILGKWHGKRLHGVDPWSEMTEDGKYMDVANVPQSQHEQNYQETLRRLHPFGDRCVIHRQTSQQAAAEFPDRSLDFVYLDARHHREALLEDLELWAPKVRHGGILAGHDCLDGTLPSGRFEVKSTVDGWAAARRLTVCCSGENVWRSWFIQMP